MITDAHRDELKRIFIQHGVVLAYLFGSQAEGSEKKPEEEKKVENADFEVMDDKDKK